MIIDDGQWMTTTTAAQLKVTLEIHLPELIGCSAFNTLKIALWSLDRKQLMSPEDVGDRAQRRKIFVAEILQPSP